MKRFLIFITGMIMLMALSAHVYGEINWYSLKEGKEIAKKERKPIFVDFFYGKGCPRCEKMEEELYNNAEIAQKIMEEFVPVRIDLSRKLAEEEEALGNLYNFKHDCLLLFLDPDGNLLKTRSGIKLCFVDAIRPEDFLRYLEEIKAQ